MAGVQNAEARKLLPIIASAVAAHRTLTYQIAASELGRDPKTNSRMVAQVCDLLDAAASLAGVPLLALVKIKEKDGYINRKAWKGPNDNPLWREAIIQNSLAHQFSKEDFAAIDNALIELDGMSNVSAWKYVRKTIPDDVLFRRLTEARAPIKGDAIDDLDLGSDSPERITSIGTSYKRDPKVRTAVLLRAKGKCEYCGQPGFITTKGEPYLEAHHMIAMAKDGADRMTNVIALCPSDHREAHFGARRGSSRERDDGQTRKHLFGTLTPSIDMNQSSFVIKRR